VLVGQATTGCPLVKAQKRLEVELAEAQAPLPYLVPVPLEQAVEEYPLHDLPAGQSSQLNPPLKELCSFEVEHVLGNMGLLHPFL